VAHDAIDEPSWSSVDSDAVDLVPFDADGGRWLPMLPPEDASDSRLTLDARDELSVPFSRARA